MKEKTATPILKVVNIIITILFVFGNQMSAVAAFADSSEADKQEKKLTFKDQQQKVTADLIKGEQYTFDLTTELRPGKNKLAFSADKFSIAEFKQAPLPERVSLVDDKKQGYTLNLNADEKQQVHLYLQVTAAGLMDKKDLTLKVQQEKFKFGEISIVKKQTAANDTDAQNDISKVTTTEDVLTAGSAGSDVDNSTNNTTVEKSESRNDKEDRKNSSIKATSKDQTTVKSQTNGGTSKQTKTPKNSSSDNAKSESSDDDSDDGADIAKLKSNLSPRADVSAMLGNNSFFTQVTFQTGGMSQPQIIDEHSQLPIDLKNGTSFTLNYDFEINDINEKIKDTKPEGLQDGDLYSFHIKGLLNVEDTDGKLSGNLMGLNPMGDAEVFGTYTIFQAENSDDAIVTFTLTNSDMLESDGTLQFGIHATYSGIGPLEAEYRSNYSLEIGVNKGTKLITKSGKFSTSEANKIDWTINLTTKGKLGDLVITDTPTVDATYGEHEFNSKSKVTAIVNGNLVVPVADIVVNDNVEISFKGDSVDVDVNTVAIILLDVS